MDGPRSRARKYFAPDRLDVGLYAVWNIEHRSFVNAFRGEIVVEAMLADAA